MLLIRDFLRRNFLFVHFRPLRIVVILRKVSFTSFQGGAILQRTRKGPSNLGPKTRGGSTQAAVWANRRTVAASVLGAIISALQIRNAKRCHVQEAIDAGGYLHDNAGSITTGRAKKVMGTAIKDRRDLVLSDVSALYHGRDRRTAMRQLEQSLRRLKTDHLDLWQIHEVVYDNDPDLHFAPDGAIDALEQARREGKVRFVGFTGHKDPAIHMKMLAHNFQFDTCQLPLNVFDATFRSFESLFCLNSTAANRPIG